MSIRIFLRQMTSLYQDSTGRIEELDFLRGIVMLTVILGHAHFPGDKYLMAFHMPLFFFLTGITSSLKQLSPFKHFVVSRGKRLLIPYLSFEIIALSISFILCRIHGDPINISLWIKDIFLVRHSIGAAAHTGIIARFWFFPCLFLASTISYPILYYCRFRIGKLLGMCAFFIIGYLVSSHLPHALPFTLDIAFVAAGFLLLGNILQRETLILLTRINLKLDLFLLVLGGAGLFISVNNNHETVSFFINHYGHFGWMLMGAMGGILFSIIVSKYLFGLLSKFCFFKGTICSIGYYSIAIFPVHIFALYFLEHLPLSFHWALLFIIASLSSLFIARLIHLYVPSIIGETPVQRSLERNK